MPASSLRLLALDGGGVRGLSSLLLLERLMETMDPDNPPRPCDCFDMIGGTGTGGLIAIMLGRLGMTVQQCIDAYIGLSGRVFRKRAHRIKINGKIQGRFDSAKLERAIFDALIEHGLHVDTLLKNENQSDDVCKVFVCATSKQTHETVTLTSYKSPHTRKDLLDHIKIWEACRATSAASSFFNPITIGFYREEFVGGAIGANNPIQELWNQAQSYWGPASIEDRVQCIVSIGTGILSLKPFRDHILRIGPTLAAVCTETEQTVERFKRDKLSLFTSGRAFRFNVSKGLEDIGLADAKKQKEIAAATGRYATSIDVVSQMEAYASSMSGRQAMLSEKFDVPVDVQKVSRTQTFIDRSSEIERLKKALLPMSAYK